MTLAIIIIFLITLIQTCFCNAEKCGEEHLIGNYGIITSPNYPNQYPENTNCTWMLHAPYNTAITIVITNLDIEQSKSKCRNHDENCCKNNFLAISNFKKFCGTKLHPQKISTSQALVKISFITTGNTKKKTGFHLIFSARNTTHCVGYDLSCLDDKGCYNSSDICNLRYECADHSDEINCAKCGDRQTSCNNHSDNCFNPLTERCNGILNCPEGEDEHDCTEICPNRIPCQNGAGCYTENQICDHHSDCQDNSDEMDCEKKLCEINNFLCDNKKCIPARLVGNGVDDCGDSSDEKGIMDSMNWQGTIFVLILILACGLGASFFMIICRWCTTRRDVRRLMLNLPQFPLPPFRGPGERICRNVRIQYSDSDFLYGADLYEAFVHRRRRIRVPERSRCLTTLIMPQGEQRLFTRCSPACATIALASLGIAPNCPANLGKDLFEKCEKLCEFCQNVSDASDSTNTPDECQRTEVGDSNNKKC